MIKLLRNMLWLGEHTARWECGSIVKINRSLQVNLETLVAGNGCRIVQARELPVGSKPVYGPGRHRMITDGLPESLFRTLAKPVEPLELEPAIHRSFASLGRDEESYSAFASSFGLLHGGIEVQIEMPQGETGKGLSVSVGEPVKIWRSEVEDMRQALRVWDWNQNRDIEDLTEFLDSRTREFPVEIQAAFMSGDLVSPSMFWISGQISKRVVGEINIHFAEEVPVSPGHMLALSIKSLRAGLWLMLGLEMHDGKKYASCAQCGKWFEIRTGSRRTTRVYCSNACRTRAYRNRQGEVRRPREKTRPQRDNETTRGR